MDYLNIYPKFKEIAFQEDRKGTLKWGKVSGQEATELLQRLGYISTYDEAKKFLLNYWTKIGSGFFIIRITRGGFHIEV